MGNNNFNDLKLVGTVSLAVVTRGPDLAFGDPPAIAVHAAFDRLGGTPGKAGHAFKGSCTVEPPRRARLAGTVGHAALPEQLNRRQERVAIEFFEHDAAVEHSSRQIARELARVTLVEMEAAATVAGCVGGKCAD